MKIIKGNLIKLALEGKFGVIIHGCNCFCTMGAGIAKNIKSEFPEAYEADLKTEKGNKDKLGTYSNAITERNGYKIIIINAYTQHHYKGRRMKADYEAIRSVFKKIKANYPGRKIGYPKIGAGLAGGDWNIISEIIEEELKNENHVLVEFAA
jgi:O-acetyl-ADP-ribose deacetylase (regulator of RNase III)